MQLRDFLTRKVISEGGNVSSKSPGWQGAADQEAEEIDLKIHDRDFMVSQLRTLLSAQNEHFKSAYGKYIWDPKLLASGKMFSGSSLQFFDVKGVNTQDFVNKLKKTKVGDIDTQIDQDMGDEVTAWLKSIVGKKVGNGTFLGFNSSLSSIWLLDDPQVRIQVDYELGPYDPKTKSPTEWFAYSHSSHYDDMAAGIKGVFHKYINRALTHAQASEKYVARVLKKGVKISDAPVTDSDYSFAVSSAQGGGMSIKYKPYIDPATGQPMEKDGIPVMQLLEPKDRDYIQNLDQQFQMTYGRKRGAADKNLQGSFVGTIQLMNKSFTPEQNESVARAFLDILFGPGAQMITKDDPARDRDIKFAAVDAMLLGGESGKPLNLPNGQGLRQNAVKMATDYADAFRAKAAGKAQVNEAEVKAQLRKGMPHLRDLKPVDFLDLIDELRSEGGQFKLQNIPLNVKIDGFGGRFGKNSEGKPFMGTSRTEPKYQAGFVKYHQEKGTTDPEILGRAANFDKLFTETMAAIKLVDNELGPDFLMDKQVTCEVLFLPFATQTDEGKLKFVGIEYDQLPAGVDLVLVPYRIVQASTGEDLPDGDRVVQQIAELGQSGNVMFMSNRLVQKDGLDVTEIINPLDNIEELKQIVSDTAGKRDRASLELRREVEAKLKPVQIALEKAIDEDPNIVGKNNLGQDYEGIVINSRLGPIKVTSQRQKDIITQKNAARAAARTDQGRNNSSKDAVVAIGSFAGHKGHEELFNYTINKAKQIGGDPFLFIGNAEGKDDPIPPAVKVQTWHKLYPAYAGNISTVQQGGSIMQKIKHELINPLPGKPPRYDNIIIMVGEDRANLPMAGALMKAVNKFQGYEHVKVSLEVTPRGTGMSFTKLRNILKDPNATPEQQYALWAQGFDEQKLGKDWILHLMDITRKGMGIQAPAAPQAAPAAPQPVAERLFNSLVRPRKAKPLAELFQPGKDWKWSFKGSEEAVAVFHVGEIPYQFYAYRPDENYPGWDVEFKNAQRGKDRITKFGLTGTGNSAEVMSTVADIMRAFLQEYQGKIKELTFSANESSRQALYARMAKRLLPTWNLTQDGREFKLSAPAEQGVAEVAGSNDDIARLKAGGKTSDGINMQDIRLMAGEGKLTKQTVLQALAVIRKHRAERGVAEQGYGNHPSQRVDPRTGKKYVPPKSPLGQGVAEGLEPQVGDAVYYGKRLVGWFKGYSEHGKIITEPNYEEMGDEYANRDVYWEPQAKITIRPEQGMSEGAPIVVMPSPERLKKPEPTKVRYQGDIVPPTKPPSTEKRGVKGRPGQRPMPDHSVEEEMLPKSAFAGSDKHKLGPAAHAKGKQKGPVKKGQFVGGMEEAKKKGADGKACWKGYRYNGTENGKDKCVPVSEDVENIMGALINKILINEAISNKKR